MRVRRRLLLAVLIGLALAGVAAWAARSVRIHAIATRAVPPRPTLTGWPAAFGDALAASESRATGYVKATAGLTQLAELYHANGFFDEAIACYRGLMELEPGTARWPYNVARILAGFGRTDDAKPLAERAVDLAPDNVTYRLRLADILLKTDQISAASKHYAAALAMDSQNPYALLGLARCDLSADDWPKARDRLREAVKKHPSFKGGWEMLATVLAHLREAPTTEEAGAIAKGGRFQDIPEPSPSDDLKNCFDAYQLSVSAATAVDREDARRRLERALELAPLNSSYHRQIAKLLLLDQNYAGARMHLETAVKFVPTDSEAWTALIDLLMRQQDMVAARTALASALIHCPESAYLHFLNGQRLRAQQRLNDAIGEFKTAIRFQPNEARAYVELSAVYVMQSRIPEALEAANAARAAEPGNSAVLNLIVRLQIMRNDEAGAQETIRVLRRASRADVADLPTLETFFREQFGHPPR